MVDAVRDVALGLGFNLTRPDIPIYGRSPDVLLKSTELDVPVVTSENDTAEDYVSELQKVTLEFRCFHEKLACVYHRARDLCQAASFLPVDLNSHRHAIETLKGFDQLLTQSYFWEKVEPDRGKLRGQIITAIDRLSRARSLQRILRRRVARMDRFCNYFPSLSN
uniref:Uncharacterized protein n=1 Tax=Schistocephalus solidus TaxID=70667 RepID=A0A0X3Q5R7_SCHSO